jgi:hypothetical protein
VRFSSVRTRGGLPSSNRWTLLSSGEGAQGNNVKQADSNQNSCTAKPTIPGGGRYKSPFKDDRW